MKTRVLSAALVSAFGLALCGTAAAAPAQDMSGAQMNCHMDFTLSGWSAIYKTASGSGNLTCGTKTVPVKLTAKGGGLTFGKYKITDGNATFTNVDTMQQVFGSYARGSAHAGVVKTGNSAVMTKGNVSMAMSGHGNGWDIGVGFGSFTIKRAAGHAHDAQ